MSISNKTAPLTALNSGWFSYREVHLVSLSRRENDIPFVLIFRWSIKYYPIPKDDQMVIETVFLTFNTFVGCMEVLSAKTFRDISKLKNNRLLFNGKVKKEKK